MLRKTAFAIAAFAALAGTAGQALAGPANHYLEQASYYLKLARMSLETTNTVTSRKDKCIWARQTLGEFNKAVEYFDMAVQADRNNPEWSESDRAQVVPFREKMMAEKQRTEKLVRDLC